MIEEEHLCPISPSTLPKSQFLLVHEFLQVIYFIFFKFEGIVIVNISLHKYYTVKSHKKLQNKFFFLFYIEDP